MLKLRVIPTLLYDGLTLVKGKNFEGWRTVSALIQQVQIYALRGVDEMILLVVGKIQSDFRLGLCTCLSGTVFQLNRPSSRIHKKGYVPVISSVAATSDGLSHNINADTVAGAISSSLKASRIIMLTDVKGVNDNKGELIEELTSKEAKKLISDGVVKSGLIPKIETCIEALENGTEAAVILDGRAPHAVLMELFTEHGGGTIIR